MLSCKDCEEIQKLQFQIDHARLVHDRIDLAIEGIQQNQQNRDIEHETIITNVVNRMDSMETKFDELRQDMRKGINDIRDEIPQLFQNAVNELLARLMKLIAVGFLGLIALGFLTIVLAFSRPYIVQGLQELTKTFQTLTERAKTVEASDVLGRWF